MALREEVLTQIAALLTAAFGLVAALAWNGAIQAIFKQIFGTVDSVTAQLSLRRDRDDYRRDRDDPGRPFGSVGEKRDPLRCGLSLLLRAPCPRSGAERRLANSGCHGRRHAPVERAREDPVR